MKLFTRGIVAICAAATAMVVAAGGAGANPIPLPPNGSLGHLLIDRAGLDRSFNQMQSRLARDIPGTVGLAVTPVGGRTSIGFGKIQAARAWSTLKVPVSIAAERASGSRVNGDVRRAIIASDNDAAERLWASFGSNARATAAVTAVLREGGDARTHVASQADRPPSYPGFTRWALSEQSVFAAQLPCLRGSGTVLGYMRQVAPNQRWGMAMPGRAGRVNAAVKGGWGPASDASGKYVVRQLAVVNTPYGRVGISMAALPANGSFEAGQAMLNRVGAWVVANLDGLPAGECGSLFATSDEQSGPVPDEQPGPVPDEQSGPVPDEQSADAGASPQTEAG